jgi:hypothetical protein
MQQLLPLRTGCMLCPMRVAQDRSRDHATLALYSLTHVTTATALQPVDQRIWQHINDYRGASKLKHKPIGVGHAILLYITFFSHTHASMPFEGQPDVLIFAVYVHAYICLVICLLQRLYTPSPES